MFKTIDSDVSAEITVKKSKFIANVFYVESVEEAENKIKEINKKYYDSRHNCYAFSIFEENGKVQRFSDNGEPSGTAGAPMLNILDGMELSNVLVIVTRYFGGILLGTGGLVRAYSDATKGALNKTNIINMELGLEAYFEVSYANLEKIKYYFETNKIKITDQKFDENVKLFVDISEEKFEQIVENREKLNFDILTFGKINKKYIKSIDFL